MKFTPNEVFRHNYHTFEVGNPEHPNTYDSEHYPDVSDEDVRTFHAAGWAEVEGMDPAPPRQPTGVTVQPDSARHAQDAPSQ